MTSKKKNVKKCLWLCARFNLYIFKPNILLLNQCHDFMNRYTMEFLDKW